MALTLREWRRLKELSQKEMADRCNVHVNTYILWEEHPERLTIEKARIVANVLDVPFSQINFSKKDA